MSTELPSIEKLQWQCRRGMLELDYVLRDFLDQHYPNLTEEDKVLFVKMLDFEDQLLIAWVMGNQEPPTPDIKRLIGLMQA